MIVGLKALKPEKIPVIQVDDASDNRPSITETVKKRGGRKSRAEEFKELQAQAAAQTPVIKEVFKPDMVEGFTNLPFSLCALLTKNQDWNLDDSDKKFLSPAMADWLNELWPEITGKYPRLAVLFVMYSGAFIKKSGEVFIKSQHKGKSPVPETSKPVVKEQMPGDGLTASERALKERAIGAL
jgi:hypothetical protein